MVRIPEPHSEVLPGVIWGTPEVVNTPAYWAVRCRWEEDVPRFVTTGSLLEEVAFCILGGFGIKYEINVAAYDRLQQHGVFAPDARPTSEDIALLLQEPLAVSGRQVRYRFPNQRARRLSSMKARLSAAALDALDPQAMRDELQSLEGIGPKTASWIVRNMLGSDEVAILDIHILRACRMMGLFPQKISLPRDYAPLERRFIDFSKAISVRPSVLDAVMWSEMRSIPARKWVRRYVDS